jgi:hypothetical protein
MHATARAALLFACGTAVSMAACRWRPFARAQDESVEWPDAAQCVGRVCAVRGTVAFSEDDGPTIRLYFDPERRDVRVLLMRGWLVTWPRYDGETIVATGKVDRFHDHVEVTVLDPTDVAVLNPIPTPTPSAGPSPTPGELEELRQRVRQLEERLRRLEGR